MVSHSNTIPEILRHLGIPDPPPIPDTEYDDLFLCILGDGPPHLLPLRYGAVAR